MGSEGGGRFDVAVTPDGSTALISNFGDRTVFLIDITNPIQPSLITSVTIPFFAEDIDISADGQYALVTDGGFSPRVASINVPSATLVYTAELGTRYANAVEVAPDGTIIVADYSGHAIHTLLLDETGVVITTGNTYTYTYPGLPITDTANVMRPVNVSMSPDGQTVIVCDAMTTTVGVYRVVAPGVLSFTGVVTGLQGTFDFYDDGHGNVSHGAVQSVAFNAAGDKAYAVLNALLMAGTTITEPVVDVQKIGVLNITGPGQVSLEAGGVVTLPHRGSSQLFGVDVIAIAGNKAFVGYPTLSGAADPVTRKTSLAIVDLTDYSITTTMVLTAEDSIPVGVATIPWLTKSARPSSARPGEAITYTIRFWNTSIYTPTNVLITDTLSANIVGDSFTHSGVALTQVPGSRYVWTVPILPPGESGVITITGVLTKPLAAGTLPNQVAGKAFDEVTTVNANLQVLNVAPVADAGPDQTRRITTLVTLDGSGSTDDNGGTLIYDWRQTGGPEVTFTPNLSLTTFTAPGAPTVLTFTLTVTDAGNLTSSDEVVVNVVQEADLAVTQEVVRSLGAITYTIVVQNLGPDPANGAVVSGIFSSEVISLTWECVASGGATCGTSSGTAFLPPVLNPFPSGGVVTYTVRGTLGLLDLGNNVVTVTPPAVYGLVDPNLLNNRAEYKIYRYLFPLMFKNYQP